MCLLGKLRSGGFGGRLLNFQSPWKDKEIVCVCSLSLVPSSCYHPPQAGVSRWVFGGPFVGKASWKGPVGLSKTAGAALCGLLPKLPELSLKCRELFCSYSSRWKDNCFREGVEAISVCLCDQLLLQVQRWVLKWYRQLNGLLRISRITML